MHLYQMWSYCLKLQGVDGNKHYERIKVIMTGKTHLAVGTAAALLITQPKSLKELIICLGAASVGAVISDIDVSTSESRGTMDKVLGITVIAAVVLALAEFNWHLGIISSLKKDSALLHLVGGGAAFLAVCAVGKRSPHRSFMHSALAVIMLTSCIYVIYEGAALCFAVAMASHIIIDMLNYKNVRLAYPCKWGISLDICHADGFFNKALFSVSSLVAVASTLYFVVNMGAVYF